MSKYNHYAKKLDQAFKKWRNDFTVAESCVKQAEKEVESANAFIETRVGEKLAKQYAAKARLEAAKIDFAETKKNGLAEYQEAVKNLSGQFRAELSADQAAKHEDMNMAAVELLKSGMMNSSDYKRMQEQFKDNRTMQRMIGHYAEQASSKADGDERAAFISVIHSTGADVENDKAREWEEMVNAADLFAGIRPDGRVNPYVKGMEGWEKTNLSAVVDAF